MGRTGSVSKKGFYGFWVDAPAPPTPQTVGNAPGAASGFRSSEADLWEKVLVLGDDRWNGK